MYQVTWVPAVHYTAGRERPVRRIVLHWMATTLAGCDATFTAGIREASAHYGLEGTKRHQYVRESDTAWHSGVRAINHESIGVEHSAQPGRPATEATILNSIDLCTELCRDYDLAADAIDQHSDFYATQCPGTLPVKRIREAVRANLTRTTPPPPEDDMANVTDAEKRLLLEAAALLKASVRERYYVIEAGALRLVDKGTEGAQRAPLLDTIDGNTLSGRIAAAAIDPAELARVIASAAPDVAQADADAIVDALAARLADKP